MSKVRSVRDAVAYVKTILNEDFASYKPEFYVVVDKGTRFALKGENTNSYAVRIDGRMFSNLDAEDIRMNLSELRERFPKSKAMKDIVVMSLDEAKRKGVMGKDVIRSEWD